MLKPIVKFIQIIERPSYIELGTVPYVDFGFGLTPAYRDKVYNLMAIAWGRTLQLAIMTEDGSLFFDGFYICEESIDSVFILSESIIFVFLNKKEVRILYTQNFSPGMYDDSVFIREDNIKLSSNSFETIDSIYSGEVRVYAEKDKGYRLLIPETGEQARGMDEVKHKDLIGPTLLQKSKCNFTPCVRKD